MKRKCIAKKVSRPSRPVSMTRPRRPGYLKETQVKYIQEMNGKMVHTSMERVFGLPISEAQKQGVIDAIQKMLAAFKAEDDQKEQGSK